MAGCRILEKAYSISNWRGAGQNLRKRHGPTNRYAGNDMNLFSYVVATDSGFAPNPFWGFCTLACCKPAIRRTASKGDFVVGLTPKAEGNKIVFIMRVTAKITLEEYWRRRDCQRKKPRIGGRDRKSKYGDNIYRRLPGGRWQQMRSQHSNPDGTENKKRKKKDVGGKYVLLSTDFVYFGSSATRLLPQFSKLIVGRGHRRLESPSSLVVSFCKFFDSLPKGIQGVPAQWTATATCSPQNRKNTPKHPKKRLCG
jgi:hypothetical protein